MIPRVPHLSGSRLGQSDLLCSEAEEELCRRTPVVVVEKLDGIAVEFFADDTGGIDVVMKRDWQHALRGRVRQSLRRWVTVHTPRLLPLLHDGRRLYGEWLWHQLVVPYDDLPSAVVFHGIADKDGALAPRLDTMPVLRAQGLAVIEPLLHDVLLFRSWSQLLPRRSAFGAGRPEGIIVEFVDDNGAAGWAKWVAPHYRQPTGRDLTGRLNRVNER